MPRAIIYPHKVDALRRAERIDEEPVFRGRTPAGEPAETPDTYLERVAKHVPVEVLPAFLLISSFDISRAARWVFFVLFGAGAVVADQLNGHRVTPAKLRPVGWIYGAFALIAYVAWALATSAPTRGLIGIKVQLATAIMVFVAFALGQVDKYIARALDPADGGGANH